MKTILCSILILICSFFNAQTNLDSLWNVWNNPSQHDTNRLKAIGDISWEYLYTKPDSAIYFAKLQSEFAQKINNKRWEASSLNTQGIGFYYLGNYDKSIELYNKSYKLFLELNKIKSSASILGNIGVIYKNRGEIDKAIEIFNESYHLSEKINDKNGIAICHQNIGDIYQEQGEFSEAEEEFLISMEIYKEKKDQEGIALILYRLAEILTLQGNIPKAIEYHYKTLDIYKKLNKQMGVGSTYISIGTIQSGIGLKQKAKENYERALNIFKEIGMKKGIAVSLINLAPFLEDSLQLEYYENAYEISSSLGEIAQMGTILNNIGSVYWKNGKQKLAMEKYFESLKLHENINNKNGISFTLINIGRSYLKMKEYKNTISYTKRALKIAQEIGLILQVREAASTLSDAYEAIGNDKIALEMYELYVTSKDSVNREENTNKLLQIEFKNKSKIDSLKHENEKEIIKIKHDGEMDQEENKRYFLYGGLVLFLVFSVFIFNRFIITRKQKQIIEKQKDVVEIQKQEVEKQKLVVDEKNKEIIDSITYAKRLQDSILPQSSTFEKLFPESFILFKPKDIVSGDFYWVKEINGCNLVAAVDCTGHGVPGAFMSLIGANGLNDAVEKHQLNDPGSILNELNRSAHQAMNKEDVNVNVRDGMDISLCAIDYINLKLYFSGAVNPIYHVRNNELNIIKGDRYSIGSFKPKEQSYTSHEISLMKGDMIYLFSDGYADQFGGLKGKKYMYKKFREILLSIHAMILDEQKTSLEQSIDAWMGSHEQVDDILVIGIRI